MVGSLRSAQDDTIARVDALEKEVERLRGEVTLLRNASRPAASAPPKVPSAGGSGFAERMMSSDTITKEDLESLVGRYGTLALAALVILMAVGAVIKMAVQRGLLTPEVRIIAGGVAALALAGAGLFFRRRGEVRYGGVLLALSLAVTDLVAWGAGPTFHIVPTGAALAVVDLVAILLAALALHDRSEFLFAIAVAGALSAPFVTSDKQGTALALLVYGGVLLAGSLRSAREPHWMRAFAVLVAGARVYALAAAALPTSGAWYGPFLISMFCGACAVAALVIGQDEWRGELPRAYLLVAVIGVMAGWDSVGARAFGVTMAVAVGLAAIAYASLLVRQEPARHWTASALTLPFISVGIAYAGASNGRIQGAVFALWTSFALAAWRRERPLSDRRGGAHLLGAAILGCLAVVALLWDMPLWFVAGLAGWGAVLSVLARNDRSVLPLGGIVLATGGAALSAIDQLVSRSAYSYTPFGSRSSASALVAAVGIALAGELLERGRGIIPEVVDRGVRLGSLIGFLIIWGRMEVAHAVNPDLAAFLLTSYYAACGVGSIVAGRQLGLGPLRVGGLMLAVYAAVKAVLEVTDINSLLLRVGAYGAVGVFLLGAGYLYRERASPGGDADRALA